MGGSPPIAVMLSEPERSKDAKRRNDIAWGVNPRYESGLMRALKGRCDGVAKSYAPATLRGATEFERLHGVHTPGCIMSPLRGFDLPRNVPREREQRQIPLA